MIDTSVLVAFERGQLDPNVLDEDGAISPIVVSELLQGVHRATAERRVRRRAMVTELLAAFPVLDITEPVAQVHAEMWTELARQGATVGAHDLWIGATAVAHGLGVLTRDGTEFARVPGLRVVAV